MLEPFWHPGAWQQGDKWLRVRLNEKELRFLCLFFFWRMGSPSLEIFSLARPHLGFLLTIYLFLIFFYSFAPGGTESAGHRERRVFDQPIQRFCLAKRHPSLSRRLTDCAAASRMSAVNDLSMKLLRRDARWRQTTQTSIVRNQVGGGSE